MKYLFINISIISLLFLTSCNPDSWLERDPQNIITDDQLWNDPTMIKSLLANYYDRMPSMHGVFNTDGMSEIDDAMWSGHQDANSHNEIQYADDYGRYWDYGFIRDINLSLENLEQYGIRLKVEDKALFNAELRFIRAFVYFELVKRMGGVPIVTKQLIYDFSGDPSPLQVARAKEYEVYDFIYKELEDIKGSLAANNASQTRASTYAALALESRAMLYAASLAKYNNLMPSPITTQGEEVGIPASKADDYYTKSLTASQTLMSGSEYQLYEVNPNKGENFYEMLNKKTKEVIFAKDYKVNFKGHSFAFQNIVRSLTEDNESSSILSPSLSLVESFDYLDGSKGTLHYKDNSGNYIAFDQITDLFANKDNRLYGTVVYGGTTFKDSPVNIQAGVAIWKNGSYQLIVAPNLGQYYDIEGGDNGLWTGLDGPKDNAMNVSNTGFYLRKMVSDVPSSSLRHMSDNWWPWFRMGEVYLNAAEAAFELNKPEGVGYINRLRERAGFPANSITTLTMDIIRNERRVELAFEDQRYFDLKRWRIAHEVWDGSDSNEDAVVYGLYPYRIVRPGHPDNNKYLFEKTRPTRFKKARFFRMANYYASIDQNVLNNNPKLVKNPFH